MLSHALRILEGQPLYGPPSVNFVPFVYTPFYPLLLAVLGNLVGLSYMLGRLVSLGSFIAALAVVFLVVRRQVGKGWTGRLWSLAAMGLIAASFPFTESWFDLVRNDSLLLALVSWFLYLICYHHQSFLALILAGLLAGLAFLTQQTSSLFVLVSGIALLFFNWRRLPIYLGMVGLVAGGTGLLWNRLSLGWFWQYTVGLKQGHDITWDRIWPETEVKLFTFFPVLGVLLGLWAVTAPMFWVRQRHLSTVDRRNLYWFLIALASLLISAMGFATEWAAQHHYIPAIYFSALAAVLVASDLTHKVRSSAWRPLFTGCLALILGAALAFQLATRFYHPAKHIPTTHDRRAGADLLAILRRIQGPVLMPYHPYYPVLVGKRPSYHEMALNDVTRVGHPFPRDIVQRIMARHYQAIILDQPPGSRYHFLFRPYKLGQYFPRSSMPRAVAGFDVQPTFLFVPKGPEPVPPGAHRIFDFESGTYANWQVEGAAFGTAPAGGPLADQGPVGPFEGAYLANSFHGGDKATGILRSSEFLVDRPYLSYRRGGGNRPAELAIRCLIGNKVMHWDTGTGSDILDQRVVNVQSHLGQRMQMELVDQAVGPGGHLLFDDLQLSAQQPKVKKEP